ncbi:hypothetical protein VTK73DRAFT_1933 [Phialemonium thermophilum]|uniref:Uncharacterized protein n=1 Tax=Phialemonium thermophilum TaxID=223376 RepID=A0ABR3X708_9PEZI
MSPLAATEDVVGFVSFVTQLRRKHTCIADAKSTRTSFLRDRVSTLPVRPAIFSPVVFGSSRHHTLRP